MFQKPIFHGMRRMVFCFSLKYIYIYFWGVFDMCSWIINTVIRYINHFLINLVVYENVSTINKRENQKERTKHFLSS